MTHQEMRVRALADQAWARLAGRYDDIRRVADGGARLDDAPLIQMVFLCAAGRLQTMAHDAAHPEESP